MILDDHDTIPEVDPHAHALRRAFPPSMRHMSLQALLELYDEPARWTPEQRALFRSKVVRGAMADLARLQRERERGTRRRVA